MHIQPHAQLALPLHTLHHAVWNIDKSCIKTKGGVIKGYDSSGVCHTLGVLLTTSETAAVWAWCVSVLHEKSKAMGGNGVVATSLLHDCVYSTFVGMALVLASLLTHQ